MQNHESESIGGVAVPSELTRASRAAIRLPHTPTLTIDEAIAHFLANRRLRNLQPNSLERYQVALDCWLIWRRAWELDTQLDAVTTDELRAFFLYLHEDHIPHQRNPHRPPNAAPGLAVSSIASTWCVLRAFFRFHKHGVAASFHPDDIPCPRVEPQIRPACDEATLDALLVACGHGADEESARDVAILTLLYESGMRVSELCGLSDARVQREGRRALVNGKGRKQGYVFWGPRGAQALARYLRLRRGAEGGPLFRGVSTRNNGGALTPNLVRAMIKRRAKATGIELPDGSPVHFLRHGFAHAALDAGASLYRLQSLMRHASPLTTARYTRENADELARAHARIFGEDSAGSGSQTA